MRKKNINTILELGIAFGGSLVFLADLYDVKTLVGIDIKDKDDNFLSKIKTSSFKDLITCYYNTSQDDRDGLTEIINLHFPDGIDMVVDDASHFLKETRDSFNIIFPFLNPGGCFVIEDYAWAHSRDFADISPPHFAGKPTMSQLAMELTALAAARPDLISQIVIDFNTISIRKGHAKVPQDFSIQSESFTYASFDFPSLRKLGSKRK